MSWLSAILGVLQALPDLVKLLNEGVAWLKHVSGDDPQGYVKKVGQAMAQLNAANTQEERISAAKSVADAVAGLP